MLLSKFHKLYFKIFFSNRGLSYSASHCLRQNWIRNDSFIFNSSLLRRDMSTGSMKAWQIHQYGLENLKLSIKDIPTIAKPNEVLVKVTAASVNPLDVFMIDSSYGENFFRFMRYLTNVGNMFAHSSFPMTGGRDFVGVVVRVGHSVSDIQVYDKVWGTVLPQKPGSHAEYVLTSDFLVSRKPENLSDVEAASIPYIGLTGWSTAVLIGGLTPNSSRGRKIAIVGANGGVGTFLTQLLSLWGAEVSGICSKESFDLVRQCGASQVFDYKNPETMEILTSNPKFHCVIDAAGTDTNEWADTLGPYDSTTVLSLKSPVLSNIDESGVFFGATKSFAQLMKSNTVEIGSGKSIKWTFFYPSKKALEQIGKLVREEKIRPVIDKVFPMEDLMSAYDHVLNGRKMGKTVIDFIS